MSVLCIRTPNSRVAIGHLWVTDNQQVLFLGLQSILMSTNHINSGLQLFTNFWICPFVHEKMVVNENSDFAHKRIEKPESLCAHLMDGLVHNFLKQQHRANETNSSVCTKCLYSHLHPAQKALFPSIWRQSFKSHKSHIPAHLTAPCTEPFQQWHHVNE